MLHNLNGSTLSCVVSVLLWYCGCMVTACVMRVNRNKALGHVFWYVSWIGLGRILLWS